MQDNLHASPNDIYRKIIENYPRYQGMTVEEKNKLNARVYALRYQDSIKTKPNYIENSCNIDNFIQSKLLENYDPCSEDDFIISSIINGLGFQEDPYLLSMTSATDINYLKSDIETNFGKGLLVIDATFKVWTTG